MPKKSRDMMAAERMDWVQVRLNGGPPCFHLCDDGSFCGRAERWPGHNEHHVFRSFADLMVEKDNLLQASLNALRSYQCGNGAPGLAEEIADFIENRTGLSAL